MKESIKLSIYTGTSATLGLAFIAAPATAFDRVHWEWNAEIAEVITKTITINAEFAPTGMVMLEDLEISIGDHTATSTVTDIFNNQPAGNGEVPEIISTATAVANNTSIQSDASIQLHEGQFAFGDGNGPSPDGSVDTNFDDLWADPGDDGDDEAGLNANLVAASVLGSAAILGLLESAHITAESTVSNIHNATVDSTATAIANNLSVELEGQGSDRLLIADIVQFSFVDTIATSDVSQVYLSNYAGLGLIDRPIVDSAATAAGNTKVITVSVGDIFDDNESGNAAFN